MLKLKIAYAPEGAAGGVGDLSDPGPVATPAAPPAVDPPPAPAATPPGAVPLDVFQRRVAALTRQKDEKDQRIAELEARVAAAPTAPVVPPVTPSAPHIPGQPSPQTHQEALFLAEQMRINEKADAIAAAGREVAPDFMARVVTMNTTIGQMQNSFIAAVADVAGNDEVAAKIIYDLGGDLGKAAEIMAMSPTKQAVALTRLAAKHAPKEDADPMPKLPGRPAPPPPIVPKIKGGATPEPSVNLADPGMSIDDWMKQRNASARKRR